jgi:uncharacterized protein (TIGR02444 family)
LTLWDYALAAWDRPGVSRACLDLQDQEGQCVPLLLWRAWALAEGRAVNARLGDDSIALARRWDGEVIAPLRAARRASGRADEAVRAAELAAERALIEALEAITPAPSGAGGDLAEALAAILEDWNGPRARTFALSLAAALR